MKDIRIASNEDLQMLYKDSAFTYIWLLDEDKQYESLKDYLFKESGLTEPEEVIMYKASGKLVNTEFKLRGKKKFPENLNIVMLPLSNFKNEEIWKLSIIKFQIGARWFDDVINNSK